jgi:tetratricopeptide (TPR) repeat protein
MVKRIKSKEQFSKLPVQLTIGVSIVTLFFNSRIQDPFNAPKMWLLLFLAALVSGQIFVGLKEVAGNKTLKISFIILTVFNSLILFASLLTDVKITAFLGENQRRTGFLTYLGFSLIFISATLYFRIGNLPKLATIGSFTGFILASYGLLQITGNDFIAWNNPYNAIISTVGNPNFAAAIMAIMGVLSTGLALNRNSKLITRSFAGLTSIFLLYIIYKSDALQGLLSFGVGVGAILIIVIWQKNSNLGKLALAFSGAAGVVAVLGMLQIGPLTSYLYKGSVTVRGYYWSAGLEMFKSNSLFGIGIDRYGSYFKEYRDKQYPLNYGFDITSTNAHNVPIQLFATGGIFVGLTYLAIVILVFVQAIKGLKKFNGPDQILFGSIFAAWLAYQAQSIISIDNIGIAIWGWLLGGAIVGISAKSEVRQLIAYSKNSNSYYLGSLISGALLIFVLVLSVALYKVESNMFQQRARFNPQIAENRQPFYEYAIKTLETPLLEPYYKMTTGAYLVSNMYVDEGMKTLLEVYKADPRNLDNLGILSDFSVQMSKVNDAIKYREEIRILDPWDAKNLLKLGQLYKGAGNIQKMDEILQAILSFAANTPEGKTAIIELKA